MRYFPLAQAFLDALAEVDAERDELRAVDLELKHLQNWGFGIDSEDREDLDAAGMRYARALLRLRVIEEHIDAL